MCVDYYNYAHFRSFKKKKNTLFWLLQICPRVMMGVARLLVGMMGSATSQQQNVV